MTTLIVAAGLVGYRLGQSKTFPQYGELSEHQTWNAAAGPGSRLCESDRVVPTTHHKEV